MDPKYRIKKPMMDTTKNSNKNIEKMLYLIITINYVFHYF